MELTARKELRLDQLDAEVRALPGLPPLAGLSARGPLDAIAEVVAAHRPDPEWALSDDRRVLRQLLAQPAADLTLLDLAQGVQALARLLEREAMS
jgi:hypothetical protein